MQNFPVYEVPPLKNWIDPSGRFTLVGDAAHAMAFYLSMGVSLAVEDAASLATVLDLACPARGDNNEPVDHAKLKMALQVFEKVRMERARVVQEASLHGGNVLHVEDEEQRAQLYATMRADGLDAPQASDEVLASKGLTYGLADQRVRDWCFGYDPVKHAQECFASMS